MRKLIKYILALLGVVLIAVVLYRLAIPRVVVVNDSSVAYDELVVQLPSSRVSFAPVAPRSSETIYFSPQSVGGEARYKLWIAGQEKAQGALSYLATGQYFRVLKIVIHENGTVSGAVTGTRLCFATHADRARSGD